MKKIIFSLIILSALLSNVVTGQVALKINPNRLILGETLNYNAKWGFLTIGKVSTKTDKRLYKIGSNICFKVDINASTNGLAKLFYLNDSWVSYIDKVNITTYKSLRSIHEGNYNLQEIVDFDYLNKKANVRVYNKDKNAYLLKRIYNTPENIRDVIAGFMLVRLIDFSKYKIGTRLNINGFYKSEGYSIDVILAAKEFIAVNNSKVYCYKIKPQVPKNKVFDGLDAVDVWLKADKTQTILKATAKLRFGDLLLEPE